LIQNKQRERNQEEDQEEFQ